MSNFNLYLDESGTANINDYSDKFFVISGILLQEEYDQDLTNYFTFLKERYGIQESTNFHATDFFEKPANDSYERMDPERIHEFCTSLGELIKTIPFKILAHAIQKDTLRSVLKIPEEYINARRKIKIEGRDLGYEIIVRKLLFEFTNNLMGLDALGLVIAESRRESDKVLLQAYLDSQEPFRFKQKPYYFDISNESRKRIISLKFENKSGLTGGLEIADICSYMLYRFLHNSLESLSDLGGTELWEIIRTKIEQPIHSEELLLSGKDMARVASDRVCKISNLILARIGSETLQTLP